MDEDTDYYRILEIDDSADEATIKQAVKANYKRLALKHHPDKNPGDENATARFQKIQHAFDILSDDIKRKQYDEGRAGHNREAAARKAREAEEQAAHARADAHKKEEQERQRRAEQQHDRQRRQQEDQRRREEEQQRKQQQQREEQARRQREERRQRDEQRRQDEERRQDKQQRAREEQRDPGLGQPEHAKSFLEWINDFVHAAAPAPISHLFKSIQSNWTPTHWWWLLGFTLMWIAWSVSSSSTSGSEPPQASRAPPLPAPLDEMLKELRIGQSLGEVQARFARKCNLPYELQLMEPLVGALIDPLDDASSVERYWDYSSNAVDGVVEAYLVTHRSVAEVEKTIEAAMSQLERMIPPQPPFYYRLIGTYTTTSNQITDKKVRQVLVPMADSIYETLDKVVMILRTTEHNLGVLLETLDNIAVSVYGESILDTYPREKLGAVVSWKLIFSRLSPNLFDFSKTGSDYFYSDTSEARQEISITGAAMLALQDRLLVFQKALLHAPLTTLENTLQLCASVLGSDWNELGTSQSFASRTQKEKRRDRRLVTWLNVF